MSRPVWLVLVSWGAAVLLISGLLSAWIWESNRQQAAENLKVKLEQDRAMCVMLDLFTGPPEPPSGPEGDRGRAILKAIKGYQQILHCEDFSLEGPVTPRPR
jgi:hypothetical protein